MFCCLLRRLSTKHDILTPLVSICPAVLLFVQDTVYSFWARICCQVELYSAQCLNHRNVLDSAYVQVFISSCWVQGKCVSRKSGSHYVFVSRNYKGVNIGFLHFFFTRKLGEKLRNSFSTEATFFFRLWAWATGTPLLLALCIYSIYTVYIIIYIWIHIIYICILYMVVSEAMGVPQCRWMLTWHVMDGKNSSLPKYQRPRKAWWWSHWATGHRWTRLDPAGFFSDLGDVCRWKSLQMIHREKQRFAVELVNQMFSTARFPLRFTRNTPDQRLVGLVMIADFYAFEMTAVKSATDFGTQ